MARTSAPRDRGTAAWDSGVYIGHGVLLFEGAGVPVAGVAGTGANRAGKGSLYIDRTNGTLYQNTGTEASPLWTSR